jgi:hypothetical protein
MAGLAAAAHESERLRLTSPREAAREAHRAELAALIARIGAHRPRIKECLILSGENQAICTYHQRGEIKLAQFNLEIF